jgi:hypothetical protein
MAQNNSKGRKGGAAALELPAADPADEKTQPGAPSPRDLQPLEVEEATQVAAPPQRETLASRVADAAAAQLLIFDQLPEDERPSAGVWTGSAARGGRPSTGVWTGSATRGGRPNDRILLVGLVWGGSTLIELEQVQRGSDLAVGRFFELPAVKLAKNFQIVKHVGDGHVLTLPADVSSRATTASSRRWRRS